MNNTEKKCKDRIKAEWRDRSADIKKLWALWNEDSDANDDDLGNLNEYGLGFWYTPAEKRRAGYFVWQFSTGGPGDEIRFWTDPQFNLIRAEYWFLDWFDGAHIDVTDNETVRDIWESFFQESTAAEGAFQQSNS